MLLCVPLTVLAQTRVNPKQIKTIGRHLDKRDSLESIINSRVKNADDHNYLSLSYENDLIGAGTDEYYTSGVRLTYFDTQTKVPPVIDALADAIPTFDLNDTTSTFFTLGQNIYTPS
ncbi:MAG: hypothetical protein CUN56_16890, partial [Phototrophicales bacterium]